MTIKKALMTIKGYCEKHIGCEHCQLKGELYCSIPEDAIPAGWDIDEMLKKKRGEQDEVD